MKLSRRCTDQFPRGIRTRGLRLHQRRRAHLAHRVDRAVLGRVQGDSGLTYSIKVDFSAVSEQVLQVYCGCPYFQGTGPCKHLWAFLKTLDDAGIEAIVGGRTSLNLLPIVEGLSSEDLSYEDPLHEDLLHEDRSYEDRPDENLLGEDLLIDKGPASPPAWRELLAAVDTVTSTPHREAHRRLWLVLDDKRPFENEGIRLRFFTQDRLKTGKFGKLKSSALGLSDLDAFEDADRKLLGFLLGLSRTDPGNQVFYGYRRSYDFEYETRKREKWVPELLFDAVLPSLCAAGKFGRLGEDGSWVEPFTLDEAAWSFKLRAEDRPEGLTLDGYFEISKEEPAAAAAQPSILPLSELDATVLASGWIFLRNHIARLQNAQRAFTWIQSLSAQGPIVVPFDEEEEALETIWTRPNLPELELPARLQRPEKRSRPVGRVQFSFSRYGSNFQVTPSFVYGDRILTPKDPAERWLQDDHVWLRDHDAEDDRLAELEDLWPLLKPTGSAADYDGSMPLRYHADPASFSELTDRLLELGWQLYAEDRQLRVSGSFSVSVQSEIDWFDLTADLEFGEQSAALPALLTAARDHSRFVRLDDGSLGLLPDDWLQRLRPMTELLDEKDFDPRKRSGAADGGAQIRIDKNRALLLDALLSSTAESVQFDAEFERLRQRIRGFSGLEPAAAPSTFVGRLRPYQELGLAWMQWLADLRLGGCLADDMGLGKTVQVLALLEQRRQSGLAEGHWNLLVVPRSLLRNWAAEAARFTPDLPTYVHHGPGRQDELTRLQGEPAAPGRVLITTYGTLLRDLEKIRALSLDAMVLDEAQAIKNPKSQTAKACRAVPARLRLALTGTPIENHLGELWSLFEFLNPGMLGHLPSMSSMVGKLRLSEEALAVVARAIRPLVLRRTKQEVLKDLPPKTEQTLTCELSKTERKRYDELRRHYRAQLGARLRTDGLKKSKMQVLEALLRLRQAACHGGLIDPGLADRSSAKIDLLLERLREVVKEGHKALVFSQFTKLLAIVRKQLDGEGITYEYLDGRARKRETKVERFQEDPGCSLFLISLKAGGVGLNLTAASYVFLLDPWWNPAVEAQAMDRAHRIGQDKPVFAYRLIARDTVEEKILVMQEQKRALADAVIAQDKRVLSGMTTEDLELLLGGSLV